MKKNKKEIPVAYTTEYDEYETIECDDSDADVSDLESDISDKVDEETILKEVEEMNNNYSFLTLKTKKKNESTKEKTKTESIELEEEKYLSD